MTLKMLLKTEAVGLWALVIRMGVVVLSLASKNNFIAFPDRKVELTIGTLPLGFQSLTQLTVSHDFCNKFP